MRLAKGIICFREAQPIGILSTGVRRFGSCEVTTDERL